MLVVDIGAIMGGGLMEHGREMVSRSIGISNVPSRLIPSRLIKGGSGITMLV